jgi:hypothetical protein
MTPAQALQILTQATEQLPASRSVHKQIMTALEVLTIATTQVPQEKVVAVK